MVFGRFAAKHKKQEYWLPRRNAWSIEESQQSDPTLRRHNIATSQRRDVSTPRRHNDFCTNIIKSKGRPNFGIIEERVDWEAENRAVVT